MSWLKEQAVFVPTLAWNVFLGRVLTVRRWWDRVDDHVVLGALPFGRDVGSLHELGVRGVVNTCKEYAGPILAYQQRGIEHLRVPTIDFTPPTLQQVDEGLTLMRRMATDGHSTYVHCKAGRGRSATIVMCWLIEQHSLSPREAQERLEEIRPHVNRMLDRRSVVLEFYDRYQELGPMDRLEGSDI